VTATQGDATALDKLAVMLRPAEWRSAADYLEAIAEIVTATGRSIEHETPCPGCGIGGWQDGTCASPDLDDADDDILYRLKYEDTDGDELAPHDAFTTLDAAIEHYRAIIDNPWPLLGGIYVTRDTGDDEHVITGHTFAASEDE
jgi:hypothetical protein